MALTEGSPVDRNVKAAGPKFKITLAGACLAGDLLGYATGWKQALATTGTAIQGKLIALEGGAIGDVIEACGEAVLGGFTGATPGGAVYGAEGSANGQYTETAPTTGGDCNTIIGYALSATEIHVRPMQRAETTV